MSVAAVAVCLRRGVATPAHRSSGAGGRGPICIPCDRADRGTHRPQYLQQFGRGVRLLGSLGPAFAPRSGPGAGARTPAQQAQRTHAPGRSRRTGIRRTLLRALARGPRPPGGLLHGVYAHMGVAQFWRRQRRASKDGATAWRAVVEFARWRDAAKEANETLLAGGCLTEAGRRFAEQMRSTLAELAQEPVPRAATARAKELGDEHRDRWLLDHGARW